jgi:muramoyltetrapeptide carboxypeptidase
MLPILRPKALNVGDTIAVAALSGGLETAEAPLYERGVNVIESLGFRVLVSPLVDLERQWWWQAAPPRDVANELNRLQRDPDVRAIFALTGGRTTLSYLDHIDYDAVTADPKPVIGMSDLGALLLALHSRTGLVGIHGELVTFGFGEWADLGDARRDELASVYRQLLTSGEPLGSLPAGNQWESWRGGRAQGPLIGALLNRLVRIQATPLALAPECFDGAILFWEEVGGNAALLWNDLHVLRVAGVFERIAGMVVGAPAGVEPVPGGPEGLRDLVIEVLGDRDVPVLGNVDIGHNGPNLPMPLGVRASLDADALTLSLLEPAVSA